MSYSIKSKEIGIFSDIHIGLGQDSSVWHKIVLDFSRWAREVYTDLGINDIIIPGDIFHNRSEISVNTLTVAKEFFDNLKDFRIFISAGNHDCYYKDRSDVNSISLFNGWNNIVVVDKTPIIIEAKGKKISLIPWGTEVEDIPEADICFGHFEIQTFKMNSYKVCDHGVDSTSLLDKSPLVFSGHFHTRDDRKYKKGRIVYVGSPYQQNFGDVDQVRGIYTFNTETNDLKFIENEKSPKHVKLHLSKLKNKEQDASYIKDNVPKNIISLVIDEDLDNDKLIALSTKLQTFNPIYFRTEYKQIDNGDVDNSTNVDYNIVDVEKNIEDFVNSMDIDHKEDVINYLNSTYKELSV
jgi:DNA repair exonuclease SbcCD nuclease subunit